MEALWIFYDKLFSFLPLQRSYFLAIFSKRGRVDLAEITI